MNCPVCKRTLASTLSICPSCGAMMNDSVREELEIKVAPAIRPLNLERKPPAPVTPKPQISAPPKPIFTTPVTGELINGKTAAAEMPKAPAAEMPKPPTAEPPPPPILVEFQNKNAALPDWRLKMQNAARQRLENQHFEPKKDSSVAAAAAAPRRTQPATRGATALKIETIEEEAPAVPKDERVAKALQRIEQSRQVYFVEEASEVEISAETVAAQSKNYPFYIAARTSETPPKPAEMKATINIPPKPKLVASVRNANGDLDTNKLPPLPAKAAAGFEKSLTAAVSVETIETPPVNVLLRTQEQVLEQKILETGADAAEEVEEIDDLAPFAMRFNAGLFDLIIGSFASLILLAPFMIAGGEWFTFTGFLAFLAVCSVVMFLYLTTALGMFGKTLGMRLFSLELVDIEENDYPSFHQAAVSSSVYLLSLAFGGIGFLTVPFTEEKRAVHDIVSNTIVVKEE